jgi:hypothetical protein
MQGLGRNQRSGEREPGPLIARRSQTFDLVRLLHEATSSKQLRIDVQLGRRFFVRPHFKPRFAAGAARG